jgi:hypothetical protein
MSDHLVPRPEKSQVSEDRPTVQIDLYGVKARGLVVDSGEPTVRTWREVGIAINGHLKRIAVSVFGLMEDVVRGSRNLIRGVTGIPEAVRVRIANAHNGADFEEWLKQQEAQRGIQVVATPETAAKRLEDVLESLKGQGVEVSMFQLKNGTWCIGLVPPEFTKTLPPLIQNSIDDRFEEIVKNNESDDDTFETILRKYGSDDEEDENRVGDGADEDDRDDDEDDRDDDEDDWDDDEDDWDDDEDDWDDDEDDWDDEDEPDSSRK